jgi:hypothetical protein
MPRADADKRRGDTKPHPRASIAGIAGRQLGVISVRQLLDIGLSRTEIHGLVERGHLHRLHRGVYAVGHRRLAPQARLIAAQLAVGSDSFLSHRTAAGVHGLRALDVRRIVLTVVSCGARSRPGLMIHRTNNDPHPSEVRTLSNGLRVSSVPRMLVESAGSETQSELERLITQAVRKGLLDFEHMERTLARHAGRRGLPKLKRALQDYRPARESGFEIAFDEFLARHPEIPEPLRNIHIGLFECDCYWPKQRLAVELDSRTYHIAALDFEKDRYKDTYLQRRRIRSMRITEKRFEHDLAGILDDLYAFLDIDQAA